MSAENPNSNGSRESASGVGFHRMIENGEWDKAMAFLSSAAADAESKTTPRNGDGPRNLAELIRVIESRDWKGLEQLVRMSPEEAERILREEPVVDAADFNPLLDELDRRE